MLSFSINSDFSTIMDKVVTKVDLTKRLSPREMEHLGMFCLSVLNTNKDYTNVTSFGYTVEKNTELNKVGREVNITSTGEKIVGATIHQSKVEMEMLDFDSMLSTVLVDNHLSYPSLLNDWFDVCELAIIDYGVNIASRLKYCLTTKLSRLELKNLMHARPKRDYSKLGQSKRLTYGVYPIFEAYGAVDLLEEVMRDTVLLDLCLNDTLMQKHWVSQQFKESV